MSARTRLALLGAAALLLASCATRTEPTAPIDPLELLGPEALAYLRLTRGAALELGPALLPAQESRELAPLLERTETLAIAFTTAAAATGGPAAFPEFEAVLRGDFPRLGTSYALRSSRGWRKEAEGWRQESSGIRVALPAPRLIVAASSDPAGLIARARLGRASAILPRRLAELDAALAPEFALFAPRPFQGLGELLNGQGLELPVAGLLIAGSPAGSLGGSPEEPAYELYVAYLADNPSAARIYRPAVRLSWYLLAKNLFPGNTAALEARFEQDGELLAAGGIRVGVAELAAALGRLRDAAQGPR